MHNMRRIWNFFSSGLLDKLNISGKGVIRISSDRDDRRILLGLKFSISEF